MLDRLYQGRSRTTIVIFCLGTIWVAGRADLTPVHRMFFRRLRGRGLDWIYHFPKLYAVDLRPLMKTLDEKKGEPEWLTYPSSEALAGEEEEKEHDRKLAEFRGSLDEGHREAVEEALKRPPPGQACRGLAVGVRVALGTNPASTGASPVASQAPPGQPLWPRTPLPPGQARWRATRGPNTIGARPETSPCRWPRTDARRGATMSALSRTTAPRCGGRGANACRPVHPALPSLPRFLARPAQQTLPAAQAEEVQG
jgi:hypothetical protein